ncbi:MAG: acyltransferase family protein [Bacillota bacterium]|nr:acyltransferase family protein [Bacillota bacterium]
MVNSTRSPKYINGLDGLRALSILAVIVYHLNLNYFKGGFLGVDVFFAISGYLITNNILVSINENNFKLREFWIKRIRRLIPSVYIMVASVLLWLRLTDIKSFNKFVLDGVSSIVYATNWWFIFHKVSYFDSFGLPSPFKNLWTLAIEEQFYIIWPIILLIGIKIFKKKYKFAVLVFILALCSAALMAVSYIPGTDPSRVYYGTDTRAFELLLGSWLAIILPIGNFSCNKKSTCKTIFLNIISLITFIVFILSIIYVNEYQGFMYRGGFLLFSLNAVLLIICVCNSGNFLNYLFSLKPVQYIGKRSYGIYLWHYPIIVLTTPINEIGNPSYLRIGIQIAAIFIIAELSYRFVEMPIRKYGFKDYFKKYFLLNFTYTKKSSFIKKTSTIVLPLVIIIIIITSNYVVRAKQHTEKIGQESKNIVTVTPSSNILVPSPTGENQATDETMIKNSNPYNQILAIGDSIMLDIDDSLKTTYPNITTDGKIGRQMYQVPELAQNYASFNEPNNAVILELGTNGYFTDEQIDTVIQSFSKTHIYLVNVRVPREWESLVNESLRKKADEYGNVTLVDWYSSSINHPEYFDGDGVHLLPEGIKTLTSLISQSFTDKNN